MYKFGTNKWRRKHRDTNTGEISTMLTHKQIISLLLYLPLMDQELWPHLASCFGSQNCRTFWETRLQTCLKLTKQSFSLPDHLFFFPLLSLSLPLSPSHPPFSCLSPASLTPISPQEQVSLTPAGEILVGVEGRGGFGFQQSNGGTLSNLPTCPHPTTHPRILLGRQGVSRSQKPGRLSSACVIAHSHFQFLLSTSACSLFPLSFQWAVLTQSLQSSPADLGCQV